MRRLFLTLLVALALGVFASPALAGGGSVAFDGGTPREQASVRAALDASSFDWGLIPRTITVHVGRYGTSYSVYGEVFLDATLLDAGRFAWGVVQHEMAHQVDFLLLDDAKRAFLLRQLGGLDWCYSVEGLRHSDYGCERFASTLAWAYWPDADNSMRPTARGDEAAAMPAPAFRALLSTMIGAPSSLVAPTAKAFAPAPKLRKRR